jgi:hypothetical protein
VEAAIRPLRTAVLLLALVSLPTVLIHELREPSPLSCAL